MVLCVGLDQESADAGLKAVFDDSEKLYWKDDETPKYMFGGIKALIAKKSMKNQTFTDILGEKKQFSLKNLKSLFMGDNESSPVLEDQGFPIVIISGIDQKYVGPLIEKFSQGVNDYVYKQQTANRDAYFIPVMQ